MRPVDADKIVESIKVQSNIVRSLGIKELTSMTNMIEEGFLQEIENAPTIEVDRPKGEWIVYKGGWKDLDYYPPKCKCNQCGHEEDLYIINAKLTNFCPNCGADMRGEREKND